MVYYTYERGQIKGHVYISPKEEPKRISIIRIPAKEKTFREINNEKVTKDHRLVRNTRRVLMYKRPWYVKAKDTVCDAVKAICGCVGDGIKSLTYTQLLECGCVAMAFTLFYLLIYMIERGII